MVAADSVTIKNLTIDGGTDRDYRNGIVSKYWGSAPVGNYAYTTVENVTVTRANFNGIYLVSLNTKSTGHKVINSTTINGGTSTCSFPNYGIAGFNVDIEVTDCDVENWTFGISTGSSGVIATANITGNTVTDAELQAYTLTLNGSGSTFTGNTATFTNSANLGTGLVTYELEDVTITNNTFTGAFNGISVGQQTKIKDKLVFGSENNISSTIRTGTSGIIASDVSWAGFARNFKVTGTSITGYETGILINPINGMTCDADINDNSITGNTINLNNLGTSPNVTLDATCNWWGSDNFNAVQATITGEAQIIPFLITDAMGATYPWSGTDTYSCLGYRPVVVYDADPNTTGTLISSHITIQEAVDEGTTLNNYFITVAAGTYNESDILITKAGLTIIGASKTTTLINPDPLKLDIKGCSSVSQGTPHNGFIIAADNITIKNLTIDGGANQDYRNGIISKFWTQASPYIANTVNYSATIVDSVKVTNTNSFGIYIRSNTGKTSGHQILNTDIIDGSSYSVCAQNAWGIYVFNTDITITNCNVANWIHGIGTGSNGTAPICNITGNTVTDAELQAYTLTLNGPGSTFTGNTATFTNSANLGTGLVTYELEDVTITNNTFTGAFNGINVGRQTKTKDKLVFGSENNISSTIRTGTSGIIASDVSWAGFARNFKVTGTSINGYETGILINPINGMTCNADINDNSVTGNTINLNNLGTSPNVTLDATCNWWGSDNFNAVQATITGEAQIIPFLITDAMGATYPWSGTDTYSCLGYRPVVVYDADPNTTGTLISSHITIQEAVNEVTTLNNYFITVSAGTYNENVTVSKSVTLRGSNFGVNANDPSDITIINGGRVAEAIINGTIRVTSTDVAIDGFKFTGASGVNTNGVATNAADGLSIINNVFENISIPAYNNTSGASAQTNLTFSNNRVDGANTASISALGAWDGISNMTINSNYFTEFERGIQLDNVSDVTISNSYFTAISHQALQIANSCADINVLENVFDNCNIPAQTDRGAIRLYSNVTGLINITNNVFTNNGNAVRVRAGAGYTHSFFVIQFNSFTSNTIGVSDGSTVISGTVNAQANWWGDGTGPSGAGPGTGNAVSLNVDFCPWLDGPLPTGMPINGSGLGEVKNTTTNILYCSIQVALDASVVGEEIHFNSGTSTETVTIDTGKKLVINTGATLTNNVNSTLTNNGTLELGGGTYNNNGVYKANGTFIGAFTNNGIFRPGN